VRLPSGENSKQQNIVTKDFVMMNNPLQIFGGERALPLAYHGMSEAATSGDFNRPLMTLVEENFVLGSRGNSPKVL
jgi:hypothetical protein